jgi:hypothetical protein
VTLALYLDDCAFAHELRDLLLVAGHTVVVPVDVGLNGARDPLHFQHAVANRLTLVTKNPIDFEALHTATLNAGGHHPGIFAIYQDNDPRDMSNAEIVAAIANAEVWYAGTGFEDMFLSLNACR